MPGAQALACGGGGGGGGSGGGGRGGGGVGGGVGGGMAAQSVTRTAHCGRQWLPVGAVGSVRQGLKESGGGMSRETRHGQGERGRIPWRVM